ncbi:RNA-binding protein 7-like isoform X1 [Branchiostoma lanceolatum]|uniref:RNA-binding protein 7-like isoform X1 n=1 Tax=Branchiostoma lanceolatum TaxID=7740 RepID=UPI0034516A2E
MVMEDGKEERTLWAGNLSSQVTEEQLYELFLQAGPLVGVTIPKDPGTGNKRSYAFIEFKHAVSVPYTIELMNGIRLHERSLRLQCRTGSKHASPAHGGTDSPNATPTHQPQFNTPTPPQLQRNFTTPIMNQPPQGFNHLLGFPTPMTPGAGLMRSPMGMPMMNPHQMAQVLSPPLAESDPGDMQRMSQQMQGSPMSQHRSNHNNMGHRNDYSPMDTPHRGSRDRDHRDQRGWGRDSDYRGGRDTDYRDRSRDRDNRRDSRHYQHRR